MKKILGLIVLAGLTGFVSCKKSDNSSNNTHDPSGSCRMTFYQDTSQINNFYYDASNRIIRAEFIYPPSDTSWTSYIYNNDHVAYMTTWTTYHYDTVRYTWDAGRYTGFTENGVVYQILYNSQNQISRVEEYQNSVKMAYTDYTWDANNNCTLCIDYSLSGQSFVVNLRTEFTFGTNKNFYHSLGIPPVNSLGMGIGMFGSVNNITRVRFVYPLQSVSSVVLFNYSSFNTNGYPLQCALTDTLNHIQSSLVMRYACP
jgi:hypothetical protein